MFTARSATECAATVDVSRAIKLVDPELVSKGCELLLRVVAMLTAMVLRLNDGPGSGSGSGSGSEL